MSDDEFPLRAAMADDWDAVERLLFGLFHHSFDEEISAVDRSVYEPERALVVTDGDQVVAHAEVLSRDLTVPGNVVPAAHVSGVGVAPEHRRRGLLTRMMHRQLRDIHDAGNEPVAVLWASEPQIYPRFGYGLAAQRLVMEIKSRQVGIPTAKLAPAGRLRGAEPSALLAELTKVYEQLRPDRPGWSSRDERWWRLRVADPSEIRQGATELRATLHETPSGADGYALWRTKSGRVDGSPCGEVQVAEVVAANPAGYLALWRFLLGIDLTRAVLFEHAAPDEPLLHLVGDPRALVPRLADALWLRIVDVAAALATRRYSTAVDVVLDVTDPVLSENTGCWRLVGDAMSATCARSGEPGDISCSIADLGAVYLGGASWETLAAAGRVREHRPGALAAAAAAFRWHQAPTSIEVF